MAASLPTELLCRIFSAANKHAYRDELESVLSFEERARAEVVSKHWRAALRSQPGAFSCLSLSPPCASTWGRQPSAQEAAAAEARALARLAALAARKPAVGTIELDLSEAAPSPALAAAHMAAIEALLSCQGASSTLAFTVSQSTVAAAPYLVKAAPPPGFQGLHIECRGLGGQHIMLLPSAALPRLPHVRRLTVQSYVRTAISLSLPMPRLESIQVFALEEELGPVSADLVAVASPPARHGAPPPLPPPFPALTHLELDAVQMKLDCSAMPALAEAQLTLVFPEAQFKIDNPSALAALTSLDLTATTVFNDALLGEMGPGEVADTAVHSNWFSRLLGGLPPGALRSLALNISEPLNTPMKRALRQLSGLTALKLRCGKEEEEEGEEGEAPVLRYRGPTVDCKMLEGMAALQELQVSSPACLANPSALGRLPALRTLRCYSINALPAVAPHLSQLTCLELGGTSASELEDEEGVCSALASMAALRRLVLGRCIYARGRDEAALEAARKEHQEALEALAAHLPAGCEVDAEPPRAGHRWGW